MNNANRPPLKIWGTSKIAHVYSCGIKRKAIAVKLYVERPNTKVFKFQIIVKDEEDIKTCLKRRVALNSRRTLQCTFKEGFFEENDLQAEIASKCLTIYFTI